jgi:2-polyprenyl-3-methyl-5-hydroxy-6-metoxy-1,4-benzoquinol methylase
LTRETRVQPASTLQEQVRQTYAAAALAVTRRGPACCEGSADGDRAEPAAVTLYSAVDRDQLPGDAIAASLGCGNPTAIADLRDGDIVLDLGSGGGIDVLLSARRVGTTGKAYGLDLTDEMLDLARRNAAEACVPNVEFLKGRIEDIPLPDASVDVVISTCVINLSTDKPAVFTETSGSSNPQDASASPTSSPRTTSPPPERPPTACARPSSEPTDPRTDQTAPGRGPTPTPREFSMGSPHRFHVTRTARR